MSGTVATDLSVMLGDEAVARAAVDAGVGAAYGYPGTPSTEILESLISWSNEKSTYVAKWCSNEKAAYEQALGASMAGQRALVTMKHVGLNVAADPFINSVLLDIGAGLVLAVADDPGMHSSQNEQDSRFYASFAHAVCLEPSDQQEAYDMTREAFRLSERLRKPVMVRLVTRIAHSRAAVAPSARDDAPSAVAEPGRSRTSWTLLPANSRRLWREIVGSRPVEAKSDAADRHNTFIHQGSGSLAVVTAGIARNYYDECVDQLSEKPTHLHLGHHPVDPDLVRALPEETRRVLVLEDGYPFVEQWLRGVLDSGIEVLGRGSGDVPSTGELSADIVRSSLGIQLSPQYETVLEVPVRAPQLCQGCPHADSFQMLRTVRGRSDESVVTSDIGCYALGALPSHAIMDSIVCMGASIGMAKGAAEAGRKNVVAAIGDSTFLHSGIPSLLDAAEANTPMTVIIMDNSTVAMTGGQPSAVPPGGLQRIVIGLGVAEDHVVTLNPLPKTADVNAAALQREVDYDGLSVVISQRSCIKVRPVKSGKSA